MKGRWVIGLHSVRAAVEVRPRSIRALHLRDDWESSKDLKELADWGQRQGLKIEKKPVSVLDRMGSGHQGVAILVADDPDFSWSTLDRAGSHRVLILDGIQDPHNLGAILRTAWLLGVEALILTENRTSPLTPTAMKVACGGAEHVPVVVEGSLQGVITTLKEKGFWVFGLAASGSNSLWKTTFPDRVAIVVGAEGKGLRITTERACDELIAIPQEAKTASFNASVATAIAMAEVKRQHHLLAGKP